MPPRLMPATLRTAQPGTPNFRRKLGRLSFRAQPPHQPCARYTQNPADSGYTILPGYDRASLQSGIIHLGLGAFVRAHHATYTDDLLAMEPGPWGITGVSLKRPDQRDRLCPQDCLYTALQRDGGTTTARIIGCVRAVLVAPEDPAGLIARMTD